MATQADEEANIGTFLWIIEGMSHCWWVRRTESIDSPTFVADGPKKTKWSLSLYPKGCIEKNWIGFYLNKEEDGNELKSIEIYYKLACLSKDGLILTEAVSTKTNIKQNQIRGNPQFLDPETVFVTHREKFLPDDTLTVQCTLYSVKESPVKPKCQYARTIFKVNRRSFEWKIDIGNLDSVHEKRYRGDLIGFDLLLNPQKMELKMRGFLFDDSLKHVSLNALVIDSNGKKKNCGFQEYLQSDLRNKTVSFQLHFPDLKIENASEYFPNGVAHLEFILSIVKSSSCSGNSAMFGFGPCVGTERYQQMTVLIDDLERMYNNEIFSDAKIFAQGQKFPVHKAVLSARSSVFRKMFETNMEEMNSGEVKIEDFQKDTVRRMLLYIYTDSLGDLELKSVDELYKIADKYNIPSLRSRCAYFLKENLHPTNACEVLVLADLHNDVDLKRAVLSFIVNQGKRVFASQAWGNFMNENLKLAADVMRIKICSR